MFDLTSDPGGVFVVADAAGPVLVAVLIDRGENAADAALLEIVGTGPVVSREAFAELVVGPAVAFGRAGRRRALHVVMPPAGVPSPGAGDVLRAAGFAHAYDFLTMRRPAAAALPTPRALPAGWRWEVLDDARVAEAHAALTDAFRDSASFLLSPIPIFRRSVASGASLWRVVLDRDEIAGLVQVAPHPNTHELRTVGRRPAYRGRGLGEHLVFEGLRLLDQHGAQDVELSVEAGNDRALALYRRFGFEVATASPVFALDLRA
jgi:ribosomal protein S18 acetylase RimI-like enzyme